MKNAALGPRFRSCETAGAGQPKLLPAESPEPYMSA